MLLPATRESGIERVVKIENRLKTRCRQGNALTHPECPRGAIRRLTGRCPGATIPDRVVVGVRQQETVRLVKKYQQASRGGEISDAASAVQGQWVAPIRSASPAAPARRLNAAHVRPLSMQLRPPTTTQVMPLAVPAHRHLARPNSTPPPNITPLAHRSRNDNAISSVSN